MSILTRIVKHTSIYVVGEILSMLASLISFPIFVRVLSKQDYGVMALVLGTILIFEMVSSLGLRHATQRYYTFYKRQNFDAFYKTTVYGSVISGVIGGCLLYMIAKVYMDTVGVGVGEAYLPMFAGLLVLVRVVFKITGCIYRVRERSVIYVAFSVASRFAGMILAVIAAGKYGGIKSILGGLCVGEATVAAAYFAYMLVNVGVPKGSYSFSMLREMIAYGLPLLISGFAGTILSLGDRYVIAYVLGTDAVASYSVPYTLCQYFSGIMSVALQFAFVPVIMNEWNNGNEAGVKREIERVIRIYAVVAIPVIFGVSALGSQFIDLLAGREYMDAPNILPLIISGTLLSGVFTPMVMGIQLAKNTKIIAALTWQAAIFNLAANLILIPFIGLYGAALTTLASYLMLLWRGAKRSREYLPIKIPFDYIGKYTACGALMFAVVKTLPLTSGRMDLIVVVLAGMFVFTLSLLMVDKEAGSLMRNVYFRVVGGRNSKG